MNDAATKTVKVRYFASFREHAGISEELLTTTANTARELFDATRDRHGSAEPAGHCKVAVNDDMATWDAPIRDGDTVLLFPPVAGG
ncbi:MAG: MoaD/ThiS family protein [Pseudomonadota bacterium]